MARIPVYQPQNNPGTLNLRIPNNLVPSFDAVGLSRQALPYNRNRHTALPVGDKWGPIMQGAGQLVGAIHKYTVAQRERREREWLSNTSTEFLIGETERFQKAQLEAPVDPVGFAEEYMEGFNERYKDALANAPSAEAHEALLKNLNGRRVEFFNRATTFENSQHAVAQGQRVREQINNMSAQVHQGTMSFAQALSQTDMAIKAVQDSLSTQQEHDIRKMAGGKFAGDHLRGLIDNGKPHEALAIMERGAYNGFLDGGDLSTLTKSAKRTIKTATTEAKLEVAEKFEDVKSHLIATGKMPDGLEGFEDEIQGAYKGPQAKAKIQELRALQTAAEVADLASNGTMEEFMGRLQEIKPKPGSDLESFSERQTAYKYAVAVGQQIQAMRVKDPAQLVIDNDKRVGQVYGKFNSALSALQGNPGDPELTALAQSSAQEYMNALNAGYKVRGMSVRQPLPAAQAKQFIASVEQMAQKQPAVALSTVTSFIDIFGEKNKSSVFSSLVENKLPAWYQVAMMPDDPLGAGAAIAEAMVSAEDAKTVFSSQERREASDLIREHARPLLKAMAARSPGRYGYEGELLNAFTAVALRRSRKPGETIQSSVNYVRESFIDAYDVSRETYYVPKSIAGTPVNVEGVHDATDNAQTYTAIKAFNPTPGPRLRGDHTLTDEQRQDRLINAAYRSGQWINTPDGRGVALAIPLSEHGDLYILRNKDGDPYMIDFATAPLSNRQSIEETFSGG